MAGRARPLTARQRRHSRWAAAIAVLLVAATLLIVALVGSGWWLLRSERGPSWLLAQVPGLRVTGLRGSVDGGPLEAARVEWQQGASRLVIDGLSWRDLWWSWRPYPGAWLAVTVVEPKARRVEWTSAPAAAGAPRPRPPASLRLPLELLLQELRIDALQVDTLPLLADVRAEAHLGAERGERHVVSQLSLRSDRGQLQARGSIGTSGERELQARADLASPPGAAQAWQARVQSRGPLERLRAEATLRAPPLARLDAQATVTPFAAWPLAALEARTSDLNLADLSSTWPATRLSGRAVVQSSALDAPVVVDLDVVNTLPGRWDQKRLPARSLKLAVRGRADQRDRLELTAFDLALGGARAAGRLTGTGLWEGDRLALDTRLDRLQPALLDARAPAMTFSGPLQAALRGLVTPPGAARHLSGEANTRLDGRVARRNAPAVRLEAVLAFDAAPNALVIDLKQLVASAGAARARASATARRDAALQWQIKSRGELAQFDPVPWWPGVAPQRGPHALNASWDADLALAQGAPGRGLPALLRTLQGQAGVQLRDSRLAGVPLAGTLALRGSGGTARLDATLQAATNRVVLEGRADAGADRWKLDLQAPALAALAPWGALFPAAQAWIPQAGAVSGDARVEGRWPAMRTEGTLRIAGFRTPVWRVDRGEARWTLTGTRVDAPLTLTVDAEGLERSTQRLERLRAELGGSLAAHKLQLTATSPLRPPAWSDPLLGVANSANGNAAGTRLALEGEGGWAPERGGGGLWRGKLRQLMAASRAPAATPWIAARDLEAQVRFDRDGDMRLASAAPGRIELLGAALRWREARWERSAANAPPRVQLDAELEPLRVAPWLAKVHPGFGWGGDLTLAGSFKVRSAERFAADLVLERAGGDLTVTDEGGTQALGLTDLRLGLLAGDGTWHFTQAVAGSNVGVLGGAQSLRVSPQASWPPADAPLEGVLELRVANLGVWAPWLPPGWRLGGQLRTSASIGGRFAAPEYIGEVVGSQLAIRNLLQGVDMREGDLAITLRGADAKVERFRFRGGDGELRLEGGAGFGATPRAQLRLTAERFQLLGRVDRRIVASGNAELALQAERIQLDGRFRVDEGLIDVSRADAPTLDSDVVVVRRSGTTQGATPPPEPAPLPPSQNPLRNAQVALQVDLGNQLRLRGHGLDTTLRGELRLATPGGQLAVNGSVRAESGTYVAYGQRLVIERGVLVFAGAASNPRLDIVAVRPNLDVRVGVAVAGTALAPRVRLFSEPELSELDKLSWLVMGRGSEGLGRTDTALLQRAAIALLAGSEGGAPTDALLKNIGLDELSLRQTQTGDVRDTVISLGKQISSRWYVGYERGVNATTGTWQLIYRIAQRFTLRAQSGAENSLDVIWTWRWN